MKKEWGALRNGDNTQSVYWKNVPNECSGNVVVLMDGVVFHCIVIMAGRVNFTIAFSMKWVRTVE